MALDFSGLPDKAEPSIGESPGGLDFSGLPDSNTDSLKGSYRQAPKPADTYSQIDNLAESTGLPKTVVENDMPSAQSLSDEPDWDAVPPKLSNVLANDLDLFKIAKDDTENLGSIERSAKAFGAGAAQATIGISKSIHETPESIARASEYLSQSLERLTGLPRMFDPLRAVQYTAEYFARGKIPGTGIQTGGMTDIANRIGEAQNILNQESETFGRLNEKGRQADEALKNFLFGRQRTLESLIRGDTGEKPPELTDLLTDPEAWAGFIGQAAPSLYTAYKSGGSIPFIAWLEGMDAADSALEFEQLTGQKLSPQQFSQAMAQSAMLNAALEKYGLDKVFGEPAGNFLSDIIKRALAEGGTEALQQFNSNAAAYTAYNPDQDLMQGVMGSAMGGAGTGGVSGGATSISIRVANRANAKETAIHRAELMSSITKAAVDSKLRGRNKEAFSRVMNQVLGDEAEDVYMSGDDAVDFFQSNPEAFDVIKENLPEVFESIQEAAETGGDIVIPAKDYITYLSDFHEQIGDKIRVGAEGVSLSEAQKWRDVDAEKFKAEADQILQQREIEDGADEIQRSIRDEIMATGRFTEDVANQYAAIHRAFSVAMSSRLGITPQEVYDKYKLRVRVPPPAAEPSPPPGEAAVPGGTLFEQAKKVGYEGGSLSEADEYKKAVDKGLDMSTAARMKRASKLGFNTKQVMYRGMDVDATAMRINEQGVVFVTPDSGLANHLHYGGKKGGVIYPLYINDENLFDYRNEKQADLLREKKSMIFRMAANGHFRALQKPEVIKFLKENGFTGFHAIEPHGEESIALFDPSKIRSINAAFDPDYIESAQILAQEQIRPIPLEDEVKQLRARVAELETELRTSKITGLRNKTAFDEDEGLGLASVGAGDMDGLKRLNDTIGHKAADAVLKTLGDVMLSAESVTEGAKVYHISGDEFAFRFDSDATGQAFMDNLQRRLENVNVELDVETPEGVVHYVYEGIGLSFGVGANYEIADQNAAKQKVERLAAGIREEARVPGAPRRLREIAGRESVVGAAYESQLSSAFGIEVSQLSDQEYQDAADLFDKLRASRSVLQTEAGTGKTLADATPEKAWSGKTTIIGKNGKPALVYRGANRALSQDDFGREALGFNTGFPASGLGVWFTSDPDEASAYGANVEPFNLDIRNPKVFTVAGDEDLPDFDSVLDALSFRDQLKEKGHDGIVIDLRDIGGGFHAVAFSPNQAIRPSEEFYQPELLQEKRGAIQFGRDVSTQESVIRLFKDADLSTFIHESGHFFFEVMTDIARQEGAPQEIKDDIQKILDWYGVEDLEAWTSISADKRRLHHEQFARGFEAYMFEGKAPSIELKGIFQRFRSWIVSIYRSIRNLDVTLTDEVRGVMDRMLATEEQIKAAEAAVNYRPLFDSIEQARMTKTEWDAYRTLNEEARADAQADLDKRSLRDMKWLANAKSKVLKQLQRDAATKRKAVAREMADELAKEPIYHAINFFKTGEMTGPEGEEIKVLQGFKLNKNEILDYFPTEELAILDLRKLKGLTSASDGMNADLAAQMFGFKNGEQLARTILAAPTLKEAIEARTDETMIERYGDISNPEEMEKAANEAIHNEARARFVASEMRALDRQVGKTSEIIRAAKQYAIETIAGKLVKEAIKPAKYRTAEARASRDAEAALKKDDIAKAAQYKRSQILNMHMAKASEDAAVEVDKAINYLKKFEKKSVRKNLRGDMLVQLDSLLTRFDLRKAPAPVGEKPTLTEWAQSEADRLDAVMPNLDPIATNEGIKKHYKDLTLDELRGLRDTVKQLEHMARREQKLYLERRNLSFEKEKLAILDEMRQAHPEIFDEEGQPMPYRKDRLPLLKEFRNRFQSKLDGEMINVENILDIMTLGHGNQIFDSLFSRLSEAQDAQTAMMKKLGKFLDPYTKAYTLKERAGFSMAASRVFVPEVGEYFTRDKRVAVALFYGSLDGRQRLKDGNNYTDNQIKAILRTLSDKDLDFVEAMWEMSDEIIWPELKALDERTKGVAAKKIDPAPFVINGRPMRGGYVPLVYDGDLSTRAYDLNTDNAIKELRGGTATQATTRQSASKQRLEEVKRPLDLSLSAISYKINETVHDVTHREAVTDTYRLLKSNRISNAIRSIAGPNVYQALQKKIREIAVSPSVPHGITERGLWYFRRNTMINMMGASFNTVAINVLGASPAIRRVGPLRFIRALHRFTSKQAKARYKWVLEKSPYMKERIDGFDRDLNTEVNRFTGKAGIMPSMGVWFAGLSIMDRAITMPTWMAAYEKSMEESGNNEDLSVQYADRVVRQTQGSGRTIDLAKVTGGVGTAGEFKRIMTMYINFFIAQYGQMVRSRRLSAKEWDEGRRIKAAMQFTLDTLAIVVIPATLEAIARGNCGDDPDLEDYMYCSVRSSALFWTSMFPLVRDIAPFAWHQFDPDTPAFGVRLSPVESAMEAFAKTPKTMADIFTDEATDKDVSALLKQLGYAFGLPGFQASRTLEGYQAFADGETDNPMALLTGAPK